MGRKRKNGSGCSIYFLLFFGLVFIAYIFDTMSSECKSVFIIVFSIVAGLIIGSIINNKYNKNKKRNNIGRVLNHSNIVSDKSLDEELHKKVIHSLDEIQQEKNRDMAELEKISEINLVSTINIEYKLPKLNDVFDKNKKNTIDDEWLNSKQEELDSILESFKIQAKVVGVNVGPRFTQFEVALKNGTKISSIRTISNEIALGLTVKEVIIEPFPGKTTVGIEIPNKELNVVHIRELLSDKKKEMMNMKLPIVLGKDKYGNNVIDDLTTLPHLIVSGSTGSGKSVCLNSFISSLLVTKDPYEVKLVLVDTTRVEFPIYNGIPHLLVPVVTDHKVASNVLYNIAREMEIRYQTFADNKVKNFDSYNEMISEKIKKNPEDTSIHKLPYLVVIVDDLFDLIIADKKCIEASIIELTKLGRGAGIHLVLSTQRPSTNIITGNIKNNIPSRIAFAVPSTADSKTIIDMAGAERLLGDGDMLFLKKGYLTPVRMQCSYVSDNEIEKIIKYISSQMKPYYDDKYFMSSDSIDVNKNKKPCGIDLYNEMMDFTIREGTISASKLQRHFGIGFNLATRIIDDFEANGIIGPQKGSKPREVLIKMVDTSDDSED